MRIKILVVFSFALLTQKVYGGTIILGQDLNTGKGISNLQIDHHWKVEITQKNKKDLEAKVLSASYFPFGHHWLLPNKDSNWITPNFSSFKQKNAPSGVYQTYYTKFYLNSWQAPSAYIDNFRWSSDNNTLKILFNNQIVWSGNTGRKAFVSWHKHSSITKGFHVGWNTLEFLIKNNFDFGHHHNNPTAFRFEGKLYYSSPATVPEPSAILLLTSGSIALFLLNCFFKKYILFKNHGLRTVKIFFKNI
jgi:hypothetical protein